MRIAVLGGGNGSYAAAADLAEQGHEVRFWRRDVAAFAPVLDSQSITLKDIKGRRDVKLARATADVGEAVRGAELLVVPTPAFAQSDIARAIAPHVSDGQVVFLPPGTFGSYVMAQGLRDAGARAAVTFAETGTLPYLTRKHGPAEIAITIRAKRLPTGAFPARRGAARTRRAPTRIPVGRADRGRAFRRADERRADHPPAADPDERGAARALPEVGHPQRRHAARDPPRDRRAG